MGLAGATSSSWIVHKIFFRDNSALKFRRYELKVLLLPLHFSKWDDACDIVSDQVWAGKLNNYVKFIGLIAVGNY